MEKTLISWNLPNIVTIALIAIVGWLVIAIAYQYIRKRINPNSGDNQDADE